MLYSIVLHSDQQPKTAELCIARGCQIALNLGIGRSGFDFSSIGADLVGMESLRRSWWELYTLDCYLSALHRRPSAMDHNIDACLPLPSWDKQYEGSGCDVNTPSLHTFERRMFMQNETLDFSPYSYRIEAARILARVLGVSLGDESHQDDVEAVDHAIAAWKLNTSDLSAHDSRLATHVSEMIFQAHLFVQSASILLHFPRSDLPMAVPTLRNISCAEGCERLVPTSNLHTAKAILASKDIADLVTLPYRLESHSPLLICGMALACMVQLAAASAHCQETVFYSLQHYQDRTALLLGALTTMGRKWRVARRSAHHLKAVANVVFAIAEPTGALENDSVHDSGIDMGGIPDNLSWFDLLSPTEFFDELQRFDNDCAVQAPLLPLTLT